MTYSRGPSRVADVCQQAGADREATGFGGTAGAVGTAESIYRCRQMSKSIHESVLKCADICLRLLSCCVVGR